MIRTCIRFRASDHTAAAINEALQLTMLYFGAQRDQVFKTIIGDNGSWFAELFLPEN